MSSRSKISAPKVKGFIARCLILIFTSGGCIYADDFDSAKAFFEQEKYTEAQNLLVPIVERAHQAKNESLENEALYFLGRTYYQQGEFESARDTLEKAVDIKPNQSDEYYWLGRAYGDLAQRASIFKQVSYASSVRKNFELAVALDPKSVKAKRALFMFYIVAPSIMGGSADKAEAVLNEIRSLSPIDADIKEIDLLRKREQNNQAVKKVADLIVQYPNNAEALLTAAMTIRSQPHLDDPEQEKNKMLNAIATFERASKIEITPDNRQFVESAIYNFAETSSWINVRTDECIKLIQDFIASKSNNKNFNKSWPTWTLAKLYKNKGDMEKFHALVKQIDNDAIKQDGGLKRDMERHGAI